jgi:hypothetical protein
MGCIPLLIPSELGLPVPKVAARKPAQFTFMPMPEASMHEYHCPKSRENDVRHARKRSYVNAKSESHSMEALPNAKLRFGVELAD